MLDGAVFDDDRLLVAAEFKDDDTRGEAADRAVAPFAMEDVGGVGEAERGRLEVGDARAVVMTRILVFCDT